MQIYVLIIKEYTLGASPTVIYSKKETLDLLTDMLLPIYQTTNMEVKLS
jgi:hypothetical protein